MKYQTEHIMMAARAHGRGDEYALELIVIAILERLSDEQLEAVLKYVKGDE